jgi:hypothetical protein
MPTYPSTRRFFRDDEFRNDNGAIAGAVRSLAQWENSTYARDLKVTPADSKIFGSQPWPWTAAWYWSPMRPLNGTTPLNLCEIVVPDGRAPYAKLKVWICRTPITGIPSASVSLVNATTGATAILSISGPRVESGPVIWESTTIAASPGDVLHLVGNWVSGPIFEILGISAYWDPASLTLPGATFNSNWYAISRNFHIDNRPMSTYALRWLGRMANAFVYQRPMQVAASWFSNPAAGTAAGYNAWPTTVGRYMVHIGGQCPSVYVQINVRNSGACSVSAALSGGASTTISVSASPGYYSLSSSMAVTPGVGGPQELVLTVTGSPAYLSVDSVTVWEGESTATSLVMGAESVPATFDPNLDERLAAGRAIRSDDIARLVDNMLWLWAYRRNRMLVADCRFVYRELDPYAFTGLGNVSNIAARHEIVASRWNVGDAFGEFEIRAGWGTSLSFDTGGYYQVGVAAWNDYAGAPAVGATASMNTNTDWAAVGQAVWQHARGGTTAMQALYAFQAQKPYAKGSRPSWLTISELPMGTPAKTYP